MKLTELVLQKKELILERLDGMEKSQRHLMFLLLGVVAVFGFARLYSISFGEIAKKKEQTKQLKTIVADSPSVELPDANILRELPKNPRNTGLDDLKLMVEELKTSVSTQQKLLEQYAQQKSKTTADPLPAVDLTSPLPNGKSDQSSQSLTPPDVNFNHLNGQNQADQAPQAPQRSAEFVTFGAEPKKASKAKAKPDLVIPRGGGVEAVLLTGVDAYVDTTSTTSKPNVTGKGSSTNLFTPFVAKVKGETIMPNNWRNSSLVDCFITGSAIGNLSSERAYLKGEGITCIAESGEVFEGGMNSVAFGEDGKAGIAGTVVSKQGSLLMKTFLAGTVSGLAQMFAPQPVMGYNSNVSGNGQQQYQWPNPNMAAQGAIANGFNKSAEQLAKFYLDYAKQMLPVVEITGGKRVTFVLQDTLTVSKFIAKE